MTPSRPISYADRRRAAARPTVRPPRNAPAAQRAREQALSLVVSFVGDTPYPLPTVYCDSATRYDWSLVDGLPAHVIVVVKPGIDARHALAEIVRRSNTIRVGYPVLVDIEAKEVACVIHGSPIDLWQVRSGTELWQQYFEPST